MTPAQFIFQIQTSDPLDMLEPEMFHVILPTQVISTA